jgi:OFA family oxalate/formate antiporter-like MFS transporter
MQSILSLVSSLLVLVCFGGLLAWSAFVPALQRQCGVTSTAAGLVFGVAIATFATSTLAFPYLKARLSVRRICAISGVLFGAGYALGSVGCGSTATLMAGPGLLLGGGMGGGYMAALTNNVGWFPKRSGLITGVSMGAYALGAVVLSQVVGQFAAIGLPVLLQLRYVGAAYAVLIVIASIGIAPAPDAPGTDSGETATNDVDRAGRGHMAVSMACGAFGGLLVIGHLKPIGIAAGLPEPLALLGISVLAVGNVCGRVGWGVAHDRFGAPSIPVAMATVAAAALMFLGAHQPALFVAACAVMGFGFGSCFVLFAAEIAARWGTDGIARIYPGVFACYAVAGIVGPAIGGVARDVTGSYAPGLAAGAVLAVGAAGVMYGYQRRYSARTLYSVAAPAVD